MKDDYCYYLIETKKVNGITITVDPIEKNKWLVQSTQPWFGYCAKGTLRECLSIIREKTRVKRFHSIRKITL